MFHRENVEAVMNSSVQILQDVLQMFVQRWWWCFVIFMIQNDAHEPDLFGFQIFAHYIIRKFPHFLQNKFPWHSVIFDGSFKKKIALTKFLKNVIF